MDGGLESMFGSMGWVTMDQVYAQMRGATSGMHREGLGSGCGNTLSDLMGWEQTIAGDQYIRGLGSPLDGFGALAQGTASANPTAFEWHASKRDAPKRSRTPGWLARAWRWMTRPKPFLRERRYLFGFIQFGWRGA